MAGTTNIPLTTLASGIHHFGPTAVADTDSTYALLIDRTVTGGLNSVPATTTVTISGEESLDGGNSWLPLAGSGTQGGVYQAPAWQGGGTITTFGVAGSFTPGTGRQVRATVTVSGGSVAAAGTLTVS